MANITQPCNRPKQFSVYLLWNLLEHSIRWQALDLLALISAASIVSTVEDSLVSTKGPSIHWLGMASPASIDPNTSLAMLFRCSYSGTMIQFEDNCCSCILSVFLSLPVYRCSFNARNNRLPHCLHSTRTAAAALIAVKPSIAINIWVFVCPHYTSHQTKEPLAMPLDSILKCRLLW